MTTAFKYTICDPLGNTQQGTLEAEDQDDAAQQLRRGGYVVVDLEEDLGELSLFAKPVRKNDIIYLTNQLAIMVDTGITLSAALTAIIAQEQNPSLKQVLVGLRSGVESGEDFSTVLARYPKYFDRTYVSLIRVSEATGSLAEMLDRIAKYLRKQLETRNKVRAAMAYPTVMLVMAIGVTIFLLAYVLPKFTPIFETRDIKLPAPTRFLMAASTMLLDHWHWWLAGAVACVVGLVLGKRTEQGRQVGDWIKISLPVLGTAMRKVIISRTVRTLGVMVHGGISMLDAIRLSADVSGNFFYEKLWLKVLADVTNGSEIHAALAGSPLLPATLVQMIKSGEETGKLDKVLERVSDYYDEEVETSLKAATSIIEPLMIAAMGVVVGGIGLALLLPVFSLSKPPT
jgi:type IV pilus assembly protein PilC